MYPKILTALFIPLLFLMTLELNAQQIGEASYYSDAYQGKKTANGEPYDKAKYTAAHRTFAFGTILKVTNLANGLSVTLRVNDRGPHKKSRIIDLSRAGAEAIDMVRSGIAQVRVELVKSPGGGEVVASSNPATTRDIGRNQPEVVIDISGQAPVYTAPEVVAAPIETNISLPNIKKGQSATRVVNAKALAPQTVHSRSVSAPPSTTPLPAGATLRTVNPAPEAPASTKGMGLYKFVSYQVAQEGYAIQIGAFNDYKNVLEVTSKLMENSVEDILIHTKIVDGKDVFKMLIGPFNSKGAAEAYKEKLASLKMKGWIVNLRELN